MSRAKIYLLIALVKAYRAYFTFEGDVYHQCASVMLRHLRLVRDSGGMYYMPNKQIEE